MIVHLDAVLFLSHIVKLYDALLLWDYSVIDEPLFPCLLLRGIMLLNMEGVCQGQSVMLLFRHVH